MSGPSTDRYDLPTGTRPGKPTRTSKPRCSISARELDPGQVPASWVNQHLQYTHGYGAVIAPADQSGVDPSDGYPDYVLSGLPPMAQPSLGVAAAHLFRHKSSIGCGYIIANSEPG